MPLELKLEVFAMKTTFTKGALLSAVVIFAAFGALALRESDSCKFIGLDSKEKAVQAKVEECNSINTHLQADTLREGPAIARSLLGLPSDADNFAISKVIDERIKSANTGRDEALAVLEMPSFTPDSILKPRIKLIDATLIVMNECDPRLGSHCGSGTPTRFKWYPHN